MKLHELKELLQANGLSPNKKLGQNFLISQHMIDKIIRSINVSPQDSILEIGPGLGAITEAMAAIAPVTAVEIDSGLFNHLLQTIGEHPHITLIHNDFLKCDLNRSFNKIVSNLPYYCSTEILFTIAREYEAEEIYVMLQKELADRILSEPGTKDYGALTVTLKMYFSAQRLFTIGKDSFYPAPDVLSAFMKFERKKNLALKGKQLELFHNIVKSVFWGRRKKLVTALTESPHLNFLKVDIKEALYKVEIDENERGEKLSLEQFIALSKQLQ